MKRMNKLIIGLVALLVLVGCSSKNNTDGGNLVIYSPSSEGIINAVIPLFEEETGIKVELISASTGELLKRIESESDSPGGDVLFGVSYSQLLSNTALFDEYVAKEDDKVIEAYRNKSGYTTYFILDCVFNELTYSG